jgi:hypothetical protein
MVRVSEGVREWFVAGAFHGCASALKSDDKVEDSISSIAE